MCTNVALVDSLECYMDELVESFQDFVRKSLLIITVAVGSLIGLLLYILKLIKQRNANFAFGDMPGIAQGMNSQGMNIQGMDQTGRNNTTTSGTDRKTDSTDPKSDSVLDAPSTPRRRCCNLSCGKSTSVSTNYVTTPDVKSSKELELRNVGLYNCPTNYIGGYSSDRPSSRTTIPSLLTCDPSCKNFDPSGPIPKTATRSCCSMCCGEQK